MNKRRIIALLTTVCMLATMFTMVPVMGEDSALNKLEPSAFVETLANSGEFNADPARLHYIEKAFDGKVGGDDKWTTGTGTDEAAVVGSMFKEFDTHKDDPTVWGAARFTLPEGHGVKKVVIVGDKRTATYFSYLKLAKDGASLDASDENAGWTAYENPGMPAEMEGYTVTWLDESGNPTSSIAQGANVQGRVVFEFAEPVDANQVALEAYRFSPNQFLSVHELEVYTASMGPQKSTYTFTYDGPVKVETNKTVDSSVTLKADEVKDEGYDAVRVLIDVQKPENSNPKLMAKDESGEYNLAETGTWGPETGFAIPADLAGNTTEIKATFDVAGEYTITYKLVDVNDNDKVIATAKTVVTVTEPVKPVLLEPSAFKAFDANVAQPQNTVDKAFDGKVTNTNGEKWAFSSAGETMLEGHKEDTIYWGSTTFDASGKGIEKVVFVTDCRGLKALKELKFYNGTIDLDPVNGADVDKWTTITKPVTAGTADGVTLSLFDKDGNQVDDMPCNAGSGYWGANYFGKVVFEFETPIVANNMSMVFDSTKSNSEVIGMFINIHNVEVYREGGEIETPVNKDALSAKVDEIDKEGLVEEEYTVDTWKALADALAEARAMLTASDATQDDVDGMVTKLTEARTALTKKPTETVNKDALKAKIDEINAEGLVASDYTAATWSAFSEAMANAEDAYKNATTQAAVDKALKDLTEARSNLLKNSDAGKKELLESALSETANLDPMAYTLASWNEYVAERNRIKGVLNDPASTDEDYTKAIEDLAAAFSKLVPSEVPVKPYPDNKIELTKEMADSKNGPGSEQYYFIDQIASGNAQWTTLNKNTAEYIIIDLQKNYTLTNIDIDFNGTSRTYGIEVYYSNAEERPEADPANWTKLENDTNSFTTPGRTSGWWSGIEDPVKIQKTVEARYLYFVGLGYAIPSDGPQTNIEKIEVFGNAIEEVVGQVNTQALEELLNECKGLIKEDYKEDSWTALEEAMAVAEEVIANQANYKQSQVNAALNTLRAAKQALIKNEADTSKLAAAVKAVNDANYVASDYEYVSWLTLSNALTIANEYLAMDPAKIEQETIDAVTAQLIAAEASLVKKDNAGGQIEFNLLKFEDYAQFIANSCQVEASATRDIINAFNGSDIRWVTSTDKSNAAAAQLFKNYPGHENDTHVWGGASFKQDMIIQKIEVVGDERVAKALKGIAVTTDAASVDPIKDEWELLTKPSDFTSNEFMSVVLKDANDNIVTNPSDIGRGAAVKGKIELTFAAPMEARSFALIYDHGNGGEGFLNHHAINVTAGENVRSYKETFENNEWVTGDPSEKTSAYVVTGTTTVADEQLTLDKNASVARRNASSSSAWNATIESGNEIYFVANAVSSIADTGMVAFYLKDNNLFATIGGSTVQIPNTTVDFTSGAQNVYLQVIDADAATGEAKAFSIAAINSNDALKVLATIFFTEGGTTATVIAADHTTYYLADVKTVASGTNPSIVAGNGPVVISFLNREVGVMPVAVTHNTDDLASIILKDAVNGSLNAKLGALLKYQTVAGTEFTYLKKEKDVTNRLSFAGLFFENYSKQGIDTITVEQAQDIASSAQTWTELLSCDTGSQVGDFLRDDQYINMTKLGAAPSTVTAFKNLTTAQRSQAANYLYKTYIKEYVTGEDLFDFNDAMLKAIEYSEDYKTPEIKPGNGGNKGGSGSKDTSYDVTIGGDPTIVAPPVISFNDLSSVPWAESAITSLVTKKVISGYEDGTFRPNNNITRDEFAKLVVTAFDITTQGAHSNFSDISTTSWQYTYVSAAANAGIVNGMGDGTFGSGQLITRQDMAAMILRAIQLRNGALKSGSAVTFNDETQIADYAKDAVAKLSTAGIINGFGGGDFAPLAYTTRAQAAKVIDGVMTQLGM